MKPRLTITCIGNLIDTISTIILYHIYGLHEINPIMGQLLVYPALFATVKIGAITALTAWLWIRRTDRHAKPLATFAAAVYGSIGVYYCILWTIIKIS